MKTDNRRPITLFELHIHGPNNLIQIEIPSDWTEVLASSEEEPASGDTEPSERRRVTPLLALLGSAGLAGAALRRRKNSEVDRESAAPERLMEAAEQVRDSDRVDEAVTSAREKVGPAVDQFEQAVGREEFDAEAFVDQTVSEIREDLETGEFDVNLDAIRTAEGPRDEGGRKGVHDALDERQETEE